MTQPTHMKAMVLRQNRGDPMVEPGPVPASVQAVFDAAPPQVGEAMADLRETIQSVAQEVGVGPLTETLKWGEPAWLTEATGAGTTLRVGWKAKRPDHVALMVHCQTDLVDRYRTQFPTEFDYEGNRAVLIPLDGPVPEEPLRRILAQALTYHRDKKRV